MGTSTSKLVATRQLKPVEAARLEPVPLVMGSPYARIGLWRNPFGELSRAQRAEMAIIDTDECLSKLKRPRSALQILGPCGHGKTTHLLAIERALPDCGYVYFPEDGSQPPLPRSRPMLIDEAQRLGWRRRRQMLRGAGPLVLGTHVDLSRALRRAGYEVCTIDVSTAKSPSELQQILNRRIAESRLEVDRASAVALDLDRLCLSLEEVVALQQQFGSNIRHIEHHLYDVFQRLAEKGETWLPAE